MTEIIQNAHDLFEFAQEKLHVPSEKASLSRRIFFYVEQHDRNRPRRYFKEVKGNCAVHSILAREQSGYLQLRELSCYCDHCIANDFASCDNASFVKNWQEHVLELQVPERRATRNDVIEIREGLLDLVLRNSIVVIASANV